MRSFSVHLGRGLGVLLGVAATTMASGQAPPAQAPPPKEAVGSVHKIVIYEGPNRSVHYVASGNLSPSDRLAAYNLERAENELAYLHDLQRLKQQYVGSERIMEPQRRYVQEQLYGTRISYGGSSGYYGSYGGYGNMGYGYGGSGFGGGYSPFAYGGYAGFGGYGGYPRASTGFAGANSYSVVRSLQYGMGDEGRLKNALVAVIARDSSSDYAASAVRGYDAALARAAGSTVLSRDLSLPKSSATSTNPEPSFAKGAQVTVWIGNDKYTGTVKDDRPEWVVLQTDKGEVTVRKSEITRAEATTKPGGGPGK